MLKISNRGDDELNMFYRRINCPNLLYLQDKPYGMLIRIDHDRQSDAAPDESPVSRLPLQLKHVKHKQR